MFRRKRALRKMQEAASEWNELALFKFVLLFSLGQCVEVFKGQGMLVAWENSFLHSILNRI